MTVFGVSNGREEGRPIVSEQLAIALLGQRIKDLLDSLLIAPLHRLHEHFRSLEINPEGEKQAIEEMGKETLSTFQSRAIKKRRK